MTRVCVWSWMLWHLGLLRWIMAQEDERLAEAVVAVVHRRPVAVAAAVVPRRPVAVVHRLSSTYNSCVALYRRSCSPRCTMS